MSAELSMWVEFATKYGLPWLLVAFMCLVCWKVLPDVRSWWRENAKQAKAMADSVPRIEKCLERIADGGESQLALMIDANRKLDQLLSREA